MEQISRVAIFEAQTKSVWVGVRGLRNREIRATLTTEGRGGGRANSQPPEEVLSGGSCVPPDSWHSEGGSASTSCAQLSPRPHSASPAVPYPAAGLLNWRFVSAQGNNTGRGVRRKRGESEEAGVLQQEDVGSRAWQDCRKEQKWQTLQQTAKIGESRNLKGWAPLELGLGKGVRGQGPPEALWKQSLN